MMLTQPDLATLLDFALRALAILAAAALVDAGARRRQLAGTARHLFWSLAIASVVLLPPLSWLLPDLHLPMPVAADMRPNSGGAPNITGAGTPSAYAGWLLTIYIAGALMVAGGYAVSRLALLLLWTSARPADDPLIKKSFAELRGSMGIRRPVALRLGAPDQMPMTWGTLRPKILLPSSAVRWPAEQVRIVLTHELGHVARMDHLTQTMARAACALHWYNPLAWYAAARLRVEQEVACDELVLRGGVNARLYARSLLDFAFGQGSAPGRARGAEAMAGKPQLEVRLEAILSPPLRRSTAKSAVAIAPLAAVALCAATLVAVPDTSVEAALPAAPQSAAQRRLSAEGMATAPMQLRVAPGSPRNAARPGPGNDLHPPRKLERLPDEDVPSSVPLEVGDHPQPPPLPPSVAPAAFSGAEPGPPPGSPPPPPPGPPEPPAAPA